MGNPLMDSLKIFKVGAVTKFGARPFQVFTVRGKKDCLKDSLAAGICRKLCGWVKRFWRTTGVKYWSLKRPSWLPSWIFKAA